MLEPDAEREPKTVIKVVGAGGCGGNAVSNMIRAGIEGVEFIALNTDSQALRRCLAPTKIQIGGMFTKGLGAGGKPDVGKRAAEEDRDQILAALKGADMVFIAAGMGGGTGTGSAPVVAEIAKECEALTVGVVTKPFLMEGRVRMRQAEEGIKELATKIGTLITIPNEKLLTQVQKDVSCLDAFKRADDVLKQSIQSITEIIQAAGEMNVDFADIRTVMSEQGAAIMGIGSCKGQDRAAEATRAAISNALLEDVEIAGAKAVLINVFGGPGLTLNDLHEAVIVISDMIPQNTPIIMGTVITPGGDQEIRVTVIATGLEKRQSPKGKAVHQIGSPWDYDEQDAQSPMGPVRRPAEDLPVGRTFIRVRRAGDGTPSLDTPRMLIKRQSDEKRG